MAEAFSMVMISAPCYAMTGGHPMYSQPDIFLINRKLIYTAKNGLTCYVSGSSQKIYC